MGIAYFCHTCIKYRDKSICGECGRECECIKYGVSPEQQEKFDEFVKKVHAIVEKFGLDND